MLTKKHRLSGKQINWLMGRGRKLFGKQFGYVVFPQRHYIKQTQWSITIPVKLDKRATMRNFLKRHAKQVFTELYAWSTMPTHRQCFVYVNKKTLDDLKQRIATNDKKAILTYWIAVCRQDFSLFFRQLCQPTSQKPSSIYGKK
jgi:RNase P protein component